MESDNSSINEKRSMNGHADHPLEKPHIDTTNVDVAAELQGSSPALAARQNNGCLLVAPDSNDGRQLCVNSGLPGSVTLGPASSTSCVCTVFTRVRLRVGPSIGHDDDTFPTCRRLRRSRRVTAIRACE